MANVTFQGNPVKLVGDLPAVGQQAPDFSLAAGDLSDKSLADYAGKRKILNIVPSLDTPVCATSTRKFNESAAALDNTVVLVISADTPFAQGRFCEVEGIKNVEALSVFRSSFGDDYGVGVAEGPLKGVTGRAVVVLDEDNKVIYTQLVSEIVDEPDYAAALESVK